MIGCFFIKLDPIGVASEYASVLESIEMTVWCIVALEFAVSLVYGLVVFDKPEVGMLTFVEYGFE